MPAKQKRVAMLNRQQRNEKQAQVVIDPLEIGLLQTANRAAPWRRVQGFHSGLNPANEKTHGHSCLEKNTGLAAPLAGSNISRQRRLLPGKPAIQRPA
ncbi:MAG: hypothetical protein P8X55_14840, partial [Desulfosarcinaceae bacterium]